MLFVVISVPVALATDSEDPKDLEVVSNILIHVTVSFFQSSTRCHL